MSRIFSTALLFLSLLALPHLAQAQLTWNFSSDDLNGGNGGDPDFNWTVLNGTPDFNGAGVVAGRIAGDPGGGNPGFAHDAAHTNFLLESPAFTFTGNDDLAGGTAAIRVLTEGGAGNQDGNPDPANPAAILSYNGGFTNSTGQKGAALLNLDTGNYDVVFYDGGNGGGVDTQSADTTTLVGSGVDLSAGYKLHIFETDEGGWGWTRFNEIELDATLGAPVAAVPEPASVAIWTLLGISSLGFGYYRMRRTRK